MKKYLHILLFLCTTPLHAQVLNGLITDGSTGKVLFPVTIINTVTRQIGYTDPQGRFSISAKTGDLLKFSLIGYKNLERTAPPVLNVAEITVEMFPQVYELDEYIFKPKYTPYQLDSIERKAVYSRALARQRSSVMSPVSFVAERISKSSKRIFRFQKQFYYWEDQKYVESRYSPDLVTRMTGLTGDSLAHFINAYPMPTEYARTATELELKMWIRSNYKEWMGKGK